MQARRPIPQQSDLFRGRSSFRTRVDAGDEVGSLTSCCSELEDASAVDLPTKSVSLGDEKGVLPLGAADGGCVGRADDPRVQPVEVVLRTETVTEASQKSDEVLLSCFLTHGLVESESIGVVDEVVETGRGYVEERLVENRLELMKISKEEDLKNDRESRTSVDDRAKVQQQKENL